MIIKTYIGCLLESIGDLYLMMNSISVKIRTLNPDDFLDYYDKIIVDKLEEYSKIITEKGDEFHPFSGILSKKGGNYILRKGKRIASCSTLLTYQGYADVVDEDILDVCVAIELYRHSILVHDDLIDMDDYRRGGESFHKFFSNDYDERFGKGIAVFYGNIFFSEALNTLLKTNFERNRLLEALKLMVEGYREVNESQVLDLLFEYKEPVLEEWEDMVSKRASSLFKVTMLTGAILAGVAGKELRLIEEAVKHIGFAFDIQDDIIGTFASEEQYGRPSGGDIILGKKPLHVIYTIQMVSDNEKEELRGLLAKKKLDKNQIEHVKKIIKNCGALERTRERTIEHATKAIETLNKTKMNKNAKQFFISLLNFVSQSLDWYR
jgi:geranylgeranyl diphosphate synthase type I